MGWFVGRGGGAVGGGGGCEDWIHPLGNKKLFPGTNTGYQ